MKTESTKTPTTRRSTKAKKSRASEGKATVVEPVSAQETASRTEEQGPAFPEEWVSIAAYYIWKNDGQPDGRDAYYWDRAKAELKQLWKDGNLPTEWKSSQEER